MPGTPLKRCRDAASQDSRRVYPPSHNIGAMATRSALQVFCFLVAAANTMRAEGISNL